MLLAALECSSGDLLKTFTMEELLVAAWRIDPMAWGLRGFEQQYPDSERIHRELDSRGKGNKGLVDMRLLDKVQARVYKLTVKGLQRASVLDPANAPAQEKANRELESRIRHILGHNVFKMWLRDASSPKSFREAGHFWGVAPGTPPRVIRERIMAVEDVVFAALEELETRKVDQMVDKRGRVLFDREDLEQCLAFQRTLQDRFDKDLRMLKVEI